MAFPLLSTSAVETGTGGATICIWKKHFSFLYNEEISFTVQSFFLHMCLKVWNPVLWDQKKAKHWILCSIITIHLLRDSQVNTIHSSIRGEMPWESLLIDFFFSFFKIKILHLNLPVTLSSHVRFPALYALFPLSVSYTKDVSVLAWLRLHVIGFAAVASLTAEWMGVLLCQGSTVPAGRT